MPARLEGKSVVVGLYGLIVGVAGGIGAVLGAYGPDGLRPVNLFVVGPQLQPTPLGLAVYGATTIGVVLGVLLALVASVSRHVDDAAAE